MVKAHHVPNRSIQAMCVCRGHIRSRPGSSVVHYTFADLSPTLALLAPDQFPGNINHTPAPLACHVSRDSCFEETKKKQPECETTFRLGGKTASKDTVREVFVSVRDRRSDQRRRKLNRPDFFFWLTCCTRGLPAPVTAGGATTSGCGGLTTGGCC